MQLTTYELKQIRRSLECAYSRMMDRYWLYRLRLKRRQTNYDAGLVNWYVDGMKTLQDMIEKATKAIEISKYLDRKYGRASD